MATYLNKNMIDGVEELPRLTEEEFDDLPIAERPRIWVKRNATETDRGITAEDVQYSSTQSTKQKIDEVNGTDYGTSGTFLSVGGTWQIPSDVWKHTFILIEIRRQGLGGFLLLDRAEVSTFDNSLVIPAPNSQYYQFTVSNTGLFTLTAKSSGLNEPVINVRGFL